MFNSLRWNIEKEINNQRWPANIGIGSIKNVIVDKIVNDTQYEHKNMPLLIAAIVIKYLSDDPTNNSKIFTKPELQNSNNLQILNDFLKDKELTSEHKKLLPTIYNDLFMFVMYAINVNISQKDTIVQYKYLTTFYRYLKVL